MQNLYRLVKGMDTISVALENIPAYLYVIILAFAVMIFVMYNVVLPKCKLTDSSITKYRAYIRWLLLILYLGIVLLITFLTGSDMVFNTLGGLFCFWFTTVWMKVMSKGGWFGGILKILTITCCIILCFCIGIFSVFHFLRIEGMESSRMNLSHIEGYLPQKEEVNENTREEFVDSLNNDPSVIWYDGKPYRYNEHLVTILCMGIDQRSKQIEQKLDVSGESGQADAVYLLVIDTGQDRMKIINISRDTMCPVKTFDYKGNYIGDSNNHLGLAYAFGDGKHQSCQYMVDTVSNLFYGIPIHSYLALNMEAIIKINDAIGGVTVTVPEDFTIASDKFVKGATVHLKGKDTIKFLRWRDTKVSHSNEQRMERQRIYIKNFKTQALSAIKNDLQLPVRMFEDLTNEMVTSITLDQVAYYATEILSMEISSEHIISLKGENIVGTVYDEFYVDEDALYELIIDTFYAEVPMGET